PKAIVAGITVPETSGVVLRGKLGPAEGHGLPQGTRALSLFVVNERSPGERGRKDEQFLFQVALELYFEAGFVPRPNRRGETSSDWDDRVSDLQFRDRFEYAVGHGVSVEVPEQVDLVRRVRTSWIPRSEVRRVVTREEKAVVTDMEKLADLGDEDAVRASLAPLMDAYGEWIASQRMIEVGTKRRSEVRDELMGRAEEAKARIAEGTELLTKDPDALEAFRLANRAMAMAARRRNPERYGEGKNPSWHLFQIAFLLLNVASIADPKNKFRENVELIFFPTGGGKTEAYLGVIAFTLLLRRLRGVARADGGLGVAVLLRYTLRLLTLDQLGRAATLMCALEELRKDRVERLGEVRFSVGLWVGQSATSNTISEVTRLITEYKNSSSKSASSPFPLTSCPWCGKELTKDSLTVRKEDAEVIVGCVDFRCAFSAAQNRDGLPVLFVDEQVYRELPGFLVATVDKFAMLPWRGETGMLFGRALAHEGRRFFGPLDKRLPKSAQALPDGLRPPELIVQDELHLISGPLGTMAGLYETAIETLSSATDETGEVVRPKVIASTATVRRASVQVRALFGRHELSIFPPPGVEDSETFFARVDRESPGRLYVGVAATGRSMKAILLRTYVSLLAAANKSYDPEGPEDQTADAYMTLAGYFNSLRELGGMRRLVEDDVRTRCALAEDKKPVDFSGAHPWFRNRLVQMEPVELTSRESTGKITESKSRLAKPYRSESHVDVLLASNMISVGVDIDRLGLMVVAGQPKTTSEYIQASSRVGRQTKWPGLVVTCFNVHKPRDRSHYERFAAYHESFYRFVEATSLTPFSGPALDRGLAGTLVAMTRLGDRDLTRPASAMVLSDHRDSGDRAAEAVAERAGRHTKLTTAEHEKLVERIRGRAQNLLDAWGSLAEQARHAATNLAYSRFDREKDAGTPLLHTADDVIPAPGSDEAKFIAPTSMRDVEPSVHLWIERKRLGALGVKS
ncbi:MAG TPA: DISARM system helicase DrmA, partial [Vicinamibacteria bacterium]|nr:DISARM system helicase DrmA [Vicinamibacteria bacterium]